MEARDPSKLPPATAHEIATVRWGVRTVVKSVLVLLGVAAFLVLELGTNVAASIGGTSSQAGAALAMMCFVPGFLLYFPLSWAGLAWAERVLRRRRG